MLGSFYHKGEFMILVLFISNRFVLYRSTWEVGRDQAQYALIINHYSKHTDIVKKETNAKGSMKFKAHK